MKHNLTCLLALGLGLAIGGAHAQNAPATDAPVVVLAQADKAAAKPAEAAPASRPDEALPLIMFEEAPLNDAIKTLARQAGINFQFDPAVANPPAGPDGKPVQPPVSIRFENITAQQALEAVLANHNLQLVTDPKTKTARITKKDPAAPDPLMTKVIQLKYTNPTNLVGILKPTVGARSTVTFDGRTSQLIVIATEKELESLDKLITTLDTPTRQVLIEAHIYETSKNPTTVKGVDWTGTLQAQKFTLGNGKTLGTVTTTTQSGSGTTAGAQAGTAIGSGTALGPLTPPFNAPATLAPGAAGSSSGSVAGQSIVEQITSAVGNGGLSLDTARGLSPATAFLNADGASAVLSFLNTDADTEVVSTPRAVTLDNEKATLSVVRAFPIFQITPGSANSPAGSTVTYTNLGTILEVTPRISANDSIALKVVPEVSSLDSKDSQTSGGQVNIANVYAIRRVEANVVVPSGHTLVMGGLVSDSTTKGYVKVPVLGDIPYFGMLFRQDTKKRNKSNLLIFITPSVVGDSDFHSAPSKFLQTKFKEKSEAEESWWDTGKPYDWKKKSSDAKDAQ
ncbi:MAG: hypothetical protein HY301_19750 [Verrucomicrobia bacterium]|nr:hypothetical protein [Verrucomicrobiota bacterium]